MPSNSWSTDMVNAVVVKSTIWGCFPLRSRLAHCNYKLGPLTQISTSAGIELYLLDVFIALSHIPGISLGRPLLKFHVIYKVLRD